MELYEANISFNINGKPCTFTVIHNLPETRGLSINDALESWVVRTKKYTDKSFCKYVMSKDPTIICITEEHYKRLNK